jgi:hypothetical protein
VSVNEKSLGPLYLARVAMTRRSVPRVVDVTEVNPPWRAGKAVLLSHRRTAAICLGIWRRQSHDIGDEDAPEFLSLLTYSPSEIADWDDGSG